MSLRCRRRAHAAGARARRAWKEIFDEFLRARATATGGEFKTVSGLDNRKNALVVALIRSDCVATFEGAVRYVHAVLEAGLRRAVVSASQNCRDVLVAAGINDLFEEVIDGVVAQRERLSGKPAPDTFLAAAHAPGVPPPAAAMLEDALAAVEAGRAGRFGFVVGVNRTDQRAALHAHGADVVVSDVAELLEAR